MTGRRINRLVFAIALLFTIIHFPEESQAANFTVATDAELISALTIANSNGQPDTISLDADIILTLANDFTDGVNGLPSILPDGGSSLTIEGNGFTIRRSGAATFRIMHISAGANVFLNDLTIENGIANASSLGTLGGGIYTAGNLTIDRGVFTGNTTTGSSGIGGGIFSNNSTLIVSNSIFFNNTSGSYGGAIYNYHNTATITNTTFSANTAVSSGGALASEVGNVTLTNSTLSGNTAMSGGAVANEFNSTLLITNSTLTNNSASIQGGGVYTAFFGVTTLHNTLISGNTAPTSAECVTDTTLMPTLTVTNSYNLLGQSGSAGGCPVGATDIVPAGAVGTVLSPLANNNGPNQTHALLLTSPAIDAANLANCPSTDQRGYARGFDGNSTVNNPQLGDCDIGAFEYALNPAYDSNPAIGTTLNLGTTPVGTEISTSLDIIETGNSSLIVSLASLTGVNATDFSIIGLSTSVGNGDAPQRIAIICNPSAVGLRIAQATFNTNDPILPAVSYDLECTGTDNVFARVSIVEINQVATEDTATLSFTVRLEVPAGFGNPGDVTVDIVDAATGNATSGLDYAAFAPLTLTFAGPLTPGTTYDQTVNVSLLEDGTPEGAEAFALRINAVTGAAEIGPNDSHTLVINDDDGVFTQASFVGNSALINEGAGTLMIDVQVFIPAGFTQTGDITLTISDGLSGNATSGADYSVFAPVVLTFVDAPFVVGTTYTQTLTLPILDDTLIEGAEVVELAVTGVSGPVTLTSPAAFTAIINDDEISTVVVTLPGTTQTIETTETVFTEGDTSFVFKTVDNPLATAGQSVTYTIRARNPKSIPLRQVVIYDVFDERLEAPQLISTTHGAGIFNGNTLVVSGFSLQPGEEAVIVVSARVGALSPGEVIPNAAILESPDASVHVSNLALVGGSSQGSSGGASQVLILPEQLPATGATPLWRWLLPASLVVTLALLGLRGNLRRLFR